MKFKSTVDLPATVLVILEKKPCFVFSKPSLRCFSSIFISSSDFDLPNILSKIPVARIKFNLFIQKNL